MQGRKGGAGEEDILIGIEHAVFFFFFIFPPFLSTIYFDNLLCLFISETGRGILFLFFTLIGVRTGWAGWGLRGGFEI